MISETSKAKRYRYNLDLLDATHEQLKVVADQHGTTIAEIVRRFISLGLIAARIQDDPDSALLIREGGREREIVLI